MKKLSLIALLLTALVLFSACNLKTGLYISENNEFAEVYSNVVALDWNGKFYQATFTGLNDGTLVTVNCDDKYYGSLKVPTNGSLATWSSADGRTTYYQISAGANSVYLWKSGDDFNTIDCWWDDNNIYFGGVQYTRFDIP